MMRDEKGRFMKGFNSSPETQIKKGQHLSKKTEFKKGRVSEKKVTVGTERLYGTDVFVKIDSKHWKLKKWLVYEKYHGTHNKNDRIIFLDGDKTNITIKNMVCVTSQVRGIMTQHKMFSSHPEITYSNYLIAKLIAKQRNAAQKA